MYRFLIIILFIGLCQNSNAQQVFVSLDQVVEYAMAHNPALLQSVLNERVEEQSYHTAISPLLPIFKASGTLNDNLILNTTLIPKEVFGGAKGTYQEVKFGTKYQITPTADFTYNLINAANYQNVSIAKQNAAIAQTNTRINTDQIKATIAQAYYRYLWDKRYEDFATINLANADTLMAIMQSRYDNQYVDELDYNRTRSTLLNARLQSDQSTLQSEKARNDLKLLAGIPVGDKVTITDQLAMESVSTTNALALTIYNRPAIRASLDRLQVNRMTLKREQLKFTPELVAYGNYGWTGQNNDFKFNAVEQKWYASSAVGLRLDVPIFAGAIKYFNVQKAQLNQQIAQIEVKNTELKTQKEDRDLVLDFEKIKMETATRRQQIKIAERNYALALVKYRNQAISYDNLINVQNELLTIQQQLLQAEANYRTIVYRIQLINQYH